ncbi:MAG: hypothetical protein SOW24_03815 [Eubacteriales bacterium]|nr:hypothetical protein [Eubacteriales bacterium]
MLSLDIVNLLCESAEPIDELLIGFKAVLPEILFGEINTCNECSILDARNGRGIEELLVNGYEFTAELGVLRIKSAGEQTAEGIGEVIEGKP